MSWVNWNADAYFTRNRIGMVILKFTNVKERTAPFFEVIIFLPGRPHFVIHRSRQLSGKESRRSRNQPTY